MNNGGKDQIKVIGDDRLARIVSGETDTKGKSIVLNIGDGAWQIACNNVEALRAFMLKFGTLGNPQLKLGANIELPEGVRLFRHGEPVGLVVGRTEQPVGDGRTLVNGKTLVTQS